MNETDEGNQGGEGQAKMMEDTIPLDPIRVVWTSNMRQQLHAHIKEHLATTEVYSKYEYQDFPPIHYNDMKNEVYSGGYHLLSLLSS